MKILKIIGIIIIGIFIIVILSWLYLIDIKINPEIKLSEILTLLINIIIAIFISIFFYKNYNERRIEKDQILEIIHEIRRNYVLLKNITIQMLNDARNIYKFDPKFKNAIKLLPNKSDTTGQAYINYERMCIDELYYLNALIEKSSFRKKHLIAFRNDIENISQYVSDHLKINKIIRNAPEDSSLEEILVQINKSFWEFNLKISDFVLKINRI